MAAADAYTSSYGSLAVHRTMLQDEVRMEAYFEAITRERELFADKVVMDLGCGSGVLAMWVGKYTRAAKVYAVEANAKMAALASELVKANGLEHVVEVLNKKAEDVSQRVDIIVSEWMGHYLLHESMLDSVLSARDRLLNEGGLLFPSKATIYGCFADLSEAELQGWNTSCFHGLDFQPLLDRVTAESGCKRSERPSDEPLLVHLSNKPNNEFVVAVLDLMTIQSEDLDGISYAGQVQFAQECQVNCVALSFTCEFPSKGVVLDTRPGRPPTHWKQTLVMLTADVNDHLPAGLGMKVKFHLVLTRPERTSRTYDIEAEILDIEE